MTPTHPSMRGCFHRNVPFQPMPAMRAFLLALLSLLSLLSLSAFSGLPRPAADVLNFGKRPLQTMPASIFRSLCEQQPEAPCCGFSGHQGCPLGGLAGRKELPDIIPENGNHPCRSHLRQG